MPAKKPDVPFDPAEALLSAFATNQRINVYMIDNLPPEAWRATPPSGKGRDIASLIGHIHNVRVMWLKAAAKDLELPAKLENDFSPADASAALDLSFRALKDLLTHSIKTDGRIKNFKPDVASFIAYLLAHDAHHRGQAAMLARQIGHPLPQKVMFGMWEWGVR